MKAYKGFASDMTCRGFRYEEGKPYTTDDAKCCETGFHAWAGSFGAATAGYRGAATAGYFAIDIDHARRFGIGHALMVSQFRQDDDRLFLRAFPGGPGVSRRFDEVLPICDDDALTIIFSAMKPGSGEAIPDLGTIDELLARRARR